jgi:hypothetical protein
MNTFTREVIAAIAAGNGPEGELYMTEMEAITAWEVDGGHLLKVLCGEEMLWLRADTSADLFVPSAIVERYHICPECEGRGASHDD